MASQRGVRGFRRGLSVVLGVLLAVTAVGGVRADAAVSFVDVPPGTQFRSEIQWLADKGISTGWLRADGKSEFRPVQPINRDAMAAFLYRYAGKPAFTAPKVSPFVDLRTSDQFYKEITWLASKGITTGWTRADGKREFRPLSPINRDAMAAFLYRFEKSPAFTAPAQSPFSDLSKSVMFYKEMTWLASKGVTTGWDQQRALPQYRALQPINRDAMAAFLYRLEVTKQPPIRGIATNAASEIANVGTMPSGFETNFDGKDPLENEITMLMTPWCDSETFTPFATMRNRSASWGATWDKEGGYASEFVVRFNSVGSAMAFMAEARARAHCVKPRQASGEVYTYNEYQRPAGEWDEALVIRAELRRFDGTWDWNRDMNTGEHLSFTRRGASVYVIKVVIDGLSPFADEQAFDRSEYVTYRLAALEG